MADRGSSVGPKPSRTQLAQVNVARLRWPLDSEPMAEFVAALGRVNALADAAPGFIWRLHNADGGHVNAADATGDPLLLINLSVWQSYQHLHEFTYRSPHAHYLRRRSEWFDKLASPATALWWVVAGERPTPTEALARLRYLRRYGPTPRAFTVRTRFDPAGRLEIRLPRTSRARPASASSSH
jgi:uncharacterized protein DUF3291